MKLTVTLMGGFLLLLSMAGCVTPRIELVSGMVTTGGEFKFEEVPVTDVHLKETAIVLTHISLFARHLTGCIRFCQRRGLGWVIIG